MGARLPTGWVVQQIFSHEGVLEEKFSMFYIILEKIQFAIGLLNSRSRRTTFPTVRSEAQNGRIDRFINITEPTNTGGVVGVYN